MASARLISHAAMHVVGIINDIAKVACTVNDYLNYKTVELFLCEGHKKSIVIKNNLIFHNSVIILHIK